MCCDVNMVDHDGILSFFMQACGRQGVVGGTVAIMRFITMRLLLFAWDLNRMPLNTRSVEPHYSPPRRLP